MPHFSTSPDSATLPSDHATHEALGITLPVLIAIGQCIKKIISLVKKYCLLLLVGNDSTFPYTSPTTGQRRFTNIDTIHSRIITPHRFSISSNRRNSDSSISMISSIQLTCCRHDGFMIHILLTTSPLQADVSHPQSSATLSCRKRFKLPYAQQTLSALLLLAF